MVQSPAAGYDIVVAGIDEPSARSTLAAMQDRLARDPTSALGLSAHASSDEVRTAFLELTKVYHPVRFGRMAIDIQKLSNEVFLALRAAHEALAKSARRRSGPIPTLMAPGASRGSTAPTTAAALGSQAMAPGGQAVAPAMHAGHAGQGHAGHAGQSHAGQGHVGQAAHPAPRTSGIPGHLPPAGSSGPRTASSFPAPAPSSGPGPIKPRPPADSTGERPPVPPRTITPTAPTAGFKPPLTRPLAGSPASRPPGAAPAPVNQVRQTGGHPVAGPTPGPATEASALDLLQRQQWDQARSVLHQLQAREPASRRIRALMCYARGREAQLDRRPDDARVELQDALDFDPELALAKTALTELFTRRK